MLTEERYHAILQKLAEHGSVTINELRDELNISESTARRDITALAKLGRLEKVFGGAVAPQAPITTFEPTVAQRSVLHTEEKTAIAAAAARLIEPADFVYIDSGTTTFALVDLLPSLPSVTYVTNGVIHAQKMAAAGKKVILIGGELKSTTEAIIGNTAILMLQKYYFTKGFFGTNGVSRQAGLTTPDATEALTKQTAMAQCRSCYCLSDSSKFDVVTPVSFAPITQPQILTEHIPEGYRAYRNIIQV